MILLLNYYSRLIKGYDQGKTFTKPLGAGDGTGKWRVGTSLLITYWGLSLTIIRT